MTPLEKFSVTALAIIAAWFLVAYWQFMNRPMTEPSYTYEYTSKVCRCGLYGNKGINIDRKPGDE